MGRRPWTQAALDAQLVKAAEAGDAAAIEWLAREGASPNAKAVGGWENGEPAAYIATRRGHMVAMETLLRLQLARQQP